MCFSAEVSFGASVAITTIGIVAYKKAGKTPFRFLAIIPILFGLQQFIEGVVWLALLYDQFSGFKTIGTYSYITFAWLIWPFYIPFSFWKLEKNHLRKKIILFLLVLGITISLTLLYVIIFRGVDASIQDCSIYYNFHTQNSLIWLFGIFYLLSTVLPAFISSIRKMWVLGSIYLVAYFSTKIYFYEQTISIWCFFAALSSIVMLWIISENVKTKLEC